MTNWQLFNRLKAKLKRQLKKCSKCVNCLPWGNLSLSATNLPVKKTQTLKNRRPDEFHFLLLGSMDGYLDLL